MDIEQIKEFIPILIEQGEGLKENKKNEVCALITSKGNNLILRVVEMSQDFKILRTLKYNGKILKYDMHDLENLI